jgi:hypothetical protein
VETWLTLCYKRHATGLMIATLIAYDVSNCVVYQATREYPDGYLLWEHIGCQQNNQKTVLVKVETDDGVEYEVRFSAWTPARQFAPSRRFHELLQSWGAQFS